MFINLDTISTFLQNYVKQVGAERYAHGSTDFRLSHVGLVHSIPEKKNGLSICRWQGGASANCFATWLMPSGFLLIARFALRETIKRICPAGKTIRTSSQCRQPKPKRIADEMQHLRISTIDMFEGFTEEMLPARHCQQQWDECGGLGFLLFPPWNPSSEYFEGTVFGLGIYFSSANCAFHFRSCLQSHSTIGLIFASASAYTKTLPFANFTYVYGPNPPVRFMKKILTGLLLSLLSQAMLRLFSGLTQGHRFFYRDDARAIFRQSRFWKAQCDALWRPEPQRLDPDRKGKKNI